MESDVRDLNYMAWKNDLAALESQKGTKWKSILKEENAAFSAALKPLKDMIKAFKKQLTLPAKDHPFTWRDWEVKRDPFSPVQTWHLKGTMFKCSAWDADSTEGFFAAAVPDPKGFERFSVEIYSVEKGFRPVRIANLQIGRAHV